MEEEEYTYFLKESELVIIKMERKTAANNLPILRQWLKEYQKREDGRGGDYEPVK